MISDYYDFFVFLGGLLILGGVAYLLFRRSLRNIFISEEEVSKLRTLNQISTTKIYFPKISLSMILLIIVLGSFLLNQFLVWRAGSAGVLGKLFSISINITRKNDK